MLCKKHSWVIIIIGMMTILKNQNKFNLNTFCLKLYQSLGRFIFFITWTTNTYSFTIFTNLKIYISATRFIWSHGISCPLLTYYCNLQTHRWWRFRYVPYVFLNLSAWCDSLFLVKNNSCMELFECIPSKSVWSVGTKRSFKK